jgi:hypothetical protein
MPTNSNAYRATNNKRGLAYYGLLLLKIKYMHIHIVDCKFILIINSQSIANNFIDVINLNNNCSEI